MPFSVQFVAVAVALWVVSKVVEAVIRILEAAKPKPSEALSDSGIVREREFQMTVLPLLNRQLEIIQRLEMTAQRTSEGAVKFHVMLEDMRAQQQRTHGNVHELTNRLTELLAMLPKRSGEHSR